MSLIRLYMDEDVRPLLAEVLRNRGYDATSAVELGRLSIPDADHWDREITESEHIQLMLRLSQRLRGKHGD